jgi:hypothetical protein
VVEQEAQRFHQVEDRHSKSLHGPACVALVHRLFAAATTLRYIAPRCGTVLTSRE